MNNPVSFINIDCFQEMRMMADNSVSLIVTDPPYGIDFKGVTSDTSWDKIDYYDFILKFLLETKRILKDDGTLWMCCARTKIPLVFNAITKAGLICNLDNWLTYARQKGRGANKKLKSQAEEILHITKSNKYTWNSVEYLREVVVPYVMDGKPRGWFLDQTTGQRVRWSGVGNVLAFTSPFFKSKFEKQIHSTQKPVLLFCELIMLSSRP
jgi:site-specific DNA-methyltransferase (adenine-specific)